MRTNQDVMQESSSNLKSQSKCKSLYEIWENEKNKNKKRKSKCLRSLFSKPYFNPIKILEENW